MTNTFRFPRGRRLVTRARRSLSMPSGASARWALVATLAISAALANSAWAGQAAGQLLLRDFKPESMLRVTETHVDRARFPVIDVHNHANDARTLTRPHPSAAELVARMDRANIQRVVILTGGWGEALQRVLDTMVKPYPDRFTVFCQLDWSKVAEPRFADEMVLLLRDAVKRGARGLKILKEFGLTYRNYFRWLETEDEYFDYYGSPGQGRWKIYGLGLPDAVLEKVYHGNADRILSRFKD